MRASRRMAASRVLPSFETLASQAPQDEARCFFAPENAGGVLCYALRRTPDNSINAPDGQITDWPVHPFPQKYSDFQNTQITSITLLVLSHKGRLEIVTDAGQDAVDASGARDEGAQLADGEVVWS